MTMFRSIEERGKTQAGRRSPRTQALQPLSSPATRQIHRSRSAEATPIRGVWARRYSACFVRPHQANNYYHSAYWYQPSSGRASRETTIPTDVVLLLLDSLDFQSLKLASLLNRNIHHLADTRLWRRVILSDIHPSDRIAVLDAPSARRRRRNLTSACDAVLRDSERTKHIRTLVIQTGRPLARYSFLSSSTIKRLGVVLMAAEHITQLEIGLSQLQYGDRDQQKLARLMARNASTFKFRLEKFICNFRMDGLLEPFLLHQPHIVEYDLFEDIQGEGPIRNADEQILARRTTILPSLNRIQGPPGCVKSWLRGRTLDTVTIKSYFTEHAIIFLREQFSDISTPSPERLTDQREVVTREANAEAQPKLPEALCSAHKLALGLWVQDDLDYQLPELINIAYGIALPPIAVLRIESYRAPHRELIPRALARFPNLQNFRWDAHGRTLLTSVLALDTGVVVEGVGEGDGAGENQNDPGAEAEAEGSQSLRRRNSANRWDPSRAKWMEQFVLDCASHVPTLRKLTLTESIGYRRTFRRLSRAAWKRREKKTGADRTSGTHFGDSAGFVWISEVELPKFVVRERSSETDISVTIPVPF